MKIYYGELYRFGYTLTVVADSEKKARSALVKEYNKAFKLRNGCAPSHEEVKNRNSDIRIIEMMPGQVEWL